MDNKPICKDCGAPLSPEAPEGLCPKCLLKVAMGSQAGTRAAGEQARTGATAAPLPEIGALAKCFPQLEILELLGQGGMGAVYKARHAALDRLVALKILPAKAAADPGFAERFNREARALARLSHPNIIAVFDFGQVQLNGQTSASASAANEAESQLGSSKPEGPVTAPALLLHYFMMEYVDGANLRQLEQSGKLSSREALLIIPQICEALQYAHDEGVVHRDIKPENVLVDKKGRVKIADFGLAKILGREAKDWRLTGARDVMGTPHYMAPEQVEHPQTVDHRADIYSLGVVFYEMLTGELPLGRFSPPSRKVQVDVRLDEVVLHALEKEPERRYQRASAIKTDVESITGSPATPNGRAVERSLEPWKLGLGATVLLLLVLVVVVGANLLRVERQKPSVTDSNTARPISAEPSFAEVLTAAKDPYIQSECLEVLSNGDIQFRSTAFTLNDSDRSWETSGFYNSDNSTVTNITDARQLPVKYETTHEAGIVRYAFKLNEPVAPGQRLAVASEGTATNVVKPTGAPGVFEYSMRHWPSAQVRIRRIELHRLPPGARLLDKEPGDLHERLRDGRVELFIDRLIPPGDSLEVIYRYRLQPGATPAKSP